MQLFIVVLAMQALSRWTVVHDLDFNNSSFVGLISFPKEQIVYSPIAGLETKAIMEKGELVLTVVREIWRRTESIW